MGGDLQHYRDSRALLMAERDDWILLTATPDPDCVRWLLDCEIGTENIIDFGVERTRLPLSHFVRRSRDSIREALKKTDRELLWMPYMSRQSDRDVAEWSGVDYWGAEEALALNYHDKSYFKERMVELGHPTITGRCIDLNSHDGMSLQEAAEQTRDSVGTSVMIKGLHGSAGFQSFEHPSRTLKEIRASLLEHGCGRVLVEPFVTSRAQPNDQWLIDRSGNLHALATTEQHLSDHRYAGSSNMLKCSEGELRTLNATPRSTAALMRDEGFIGVFGIDYLISGEGVAYAIENNTRINACTCLIECLLRQGLDRKSKSMTKNLTVYGRLCRIDIDGAGSRVPGSRPPGGLQARRERSFHSRGRVFPLATPRCHVANSIHPR